MNEVVMSAYRRYRMERTNANLTPEQFALLLQIYPSIVVARADGHIDANETKALHKVATHLLGRSDAGVEEALKAEMRYVGWDVNYWRTPFVEALKALIADGTVKPAHIVDFMTSVASSSTGTLLGNIQMKVGGETESPYISEEERSAIYEMVQALELSNDPAVKKTLEYTFSTS
ncbi:MAG: hypothetical protein RMM53_00105 [Bacteroidia bacterium]|nr:TerB family tellurite resistance protein [Bacteroidia bacterium]MDW8332596.1 hypothetical protein [Bacteroidia bacterium]